MARWATIFRLRRALLTNRWAAVSSARRRKVALLATITLGFLLVAGHLAAPLLMAPPLDLATPRGLTEDDLPAGAGALEAAFWLSALIAAVLNFRVLELLFRRPDVVALQPLPIEPPAFFLDRLLATLGEALGASLITSLFFLPLVWHDGGAAFLACTAMLAGGLIVGGLVSLAVTLAATRQLVPDEPSSSGNARRPVAADAYGGPGQILLYAPALSLAGIVVLLLFWKLLIGEPLRLGHLSDPFVVGTLLLVGIAAACLAYAYRLFCDAYFSMVPRFHEADSTDYNALIDYQTSSFDTPRRSEIGLGNSAAVFRVILIDDDRRMAGRRVGHAVVLALAVLGLLFLDPDVLPPWAIGLVPATLLALFINPWARLKRRSQCITDTMALPVSPGIRGRAIARLALRESLFLSVPYALAVILVLGWWRSMGDTSVEIGLFSLAAGPAISALMALFLVRLRGLTLIWLPIFFLCAMAALAITSFFSATLVAMALFLSAPIIERSLSHG